MIKCWKIIDRWAKSAQITADEQWLASSIEFNRIWLKEGEPDRFEIVEGYFTPFVQIPPEIKP